MKGAAGFEAFYGELYGSRWEALKRAMQSAGGAVGLSVAGCEPYYLDIASVVAASLLQVRPGHSVVDLCAAPGGKSLILAALLAGEGSLVSNDRSAARRSRLRSVLQSSLPDRLRLAVSVTGHDASRWAVFHPCEYDRILADVPCSCEQHVLGSPDALKAWSPSRTKRLAQGAYAIGCAACDALKAGGRMVYATCALSHRENDTVVERLLERAGGLLMAIDAEADISRVFKGLACGRVPGADEALLTGSSTAVAKLRPEKTAFGYSILPDRSMSGPLYFSVLRRTVCNSD